jgi:hypothetical protein
MVARRDSADTAPWACGRGDWTLPPMPLTYSMVRDASINSTTGGGAPPASRHGAMPMRLTRTSICLAITLAVSGAFAQVPPIPGSPAPVGHRQPTLRGLPPDVAHEEGQPGETPSRAQIPRGRGGSPPPTLLVGPSCEAAGQGSVVLGRDKKACLADETTAQDTLKQNWSKYAASDKSDCVGMVKTGGPASYVELLSCVEILRDARNIRNADALESDDQSVSTRRGQDNARPVRAKRRHST